MEAFGSGDRRVSHKGDDVMQSIEKAFLDFDKGIRPDGYRAPKYWYVLSSKGKPYPAKAIWAMAINDRPGNFNTRDARIGFTKLEYSLIDTRVTFEQADFDAEVEKSKSDSKENRQQRLKNASKEPEVVYTLSKLFMRNPDVVAEVLSRANGICEKCESPAPFLRKRDETPYLEVHHIHQLAHGGNDTVENSIALCPNCHRKYHFG